MKFMKILFRISLLLLIVALGAATWWYFIDSRAPESRPDLVRLPDSFPPAPKGYVSTNAIIVSYGLGLIDLVDVEVGDREASRCR